MPYEFTVQEIIRLLFLQEVQLQRGKINFSLANITFTVESKDVIGGILQEWFENWMKNNNIVFSKKANSQEWPDFTLANQILLEIKSFNNANAPGFDIANFDAYARSLLENPQRLDSDYLIFGYVTKDKYISIHEIWHKKVWEITGPSEKNLLTLQVKQNVPTNIRPKDWRKKNDRHFKCRRDFVVALSNALKKFKTKIGVENPDWLEKVEASYLQITGQIL